MNRIIRQAKKGKRAQGLVEFALVLPLLLVLLIGIIEVGRMLVIYTSVASASREAARYGAAAGRNPSNQPYYLDTSGMAAAASRLTALTGVNNVRIEYDHGPGSAEFTPSGLTTVVLGDRISVTVSANYQPLFGLVPGLQPFTIRSSTARTILKELSIIGPPPPANSATANAQASQTNTASTATAAYATQAVQQTQTASAEAPTHAAQTATAAVQQTDDAYASQTAAALATSAQQTTEAGYLTQTANAIQQTEAAATQTMSALLTLGPLALTQAVQTQEAWRTTQTAAAYQLTALAVAQTAAAQTATANAPTLTPTPTDTLTPTPTNTATATPGACQISAGTYTNVAGIINWTLTNNTSGAYAATYTLRYLNIPWRPGSNANLRFMKVKFGGNELWKDNQGDTGDNGSSFGISPEGEYHWSPYLGNGSTRTEFQFAPGSKTFELSWNAAVTWPGSTTFAVAIFRNEARNEDCTVYMAFYP